LGSSTKKEPHRGDVSARKRVRATRRARKNISRLALNSRDEKKAAEKQRKKTPPRKIGSEKQTRRERGRLSRMKKRAAVERETL